MTYLVYSHLGLHYEGEDLDLANTYADSVIEAERCFGYHTWPIYMNDYQPKYIIREHVCFDDIYRFVSIRRKMDE